jgi:hypothetical protein
MTAEILVMNKEAIALAADSAVTTFGEQKIFTSANKLFSLSKYHPIGIMIYGNASFMGIPWETLIKMFRKNIGNTEFDTLHEYATYFINFLMSDAILIPEEEQKNYIKFSIYMYFDFINDLIKKQVSKELDQKKNLSEADVKSIISNIIKNQYDVWTAEGNIPSIPPEFNKEIIDQNGEVIRQAIIDIFGVLPLTTRQKTQLKKLCGDIFAKFPKKPHKQSVSGVVVAGFGKDDIFPSFIAYEVDGLIKRNLKYKILDEGKIDFNNGATLRAFAQGEMVFTFIEGINPDYMLLQQQYLEHILKDYSEWVFDNMTKDTNVSKRKKVKNILNKINSDIITEYDKKLKQFRFDYFSSPILNVITVLPKDELAGMAESLVNITSFKRRVSMDTETVGGPIDVAIISKGDGFIWIKKKHYFKSNLNMKFFQNYYNHGEDLNEN